MAKKIVSARVRDVLAAVERIAPARLAESWDNVGLQTGDPSAPAGSVLVALEASSAVVSLACKAKAGVLLTHHPLLFRERKTFAVTDPASRLANDLVRGGVALIAAHTNLDSVAHGTNGVVADMIGLLPERAFLSPAENRSEKVKFSVFVPADFSDAVIDAIGRAGAGVIGNYSHCTFRTEGTGTYVPLQGANPFAGKVGKLEHAPELRIEAECQRSNLRNLIEAVRAVHPYDEMAFDLYTLTVDPRPRHGLGLIGSLGTAESLNALAARMRKVFAVSAVKAIGDPRSKHERIAICTGSGGEFVRSGQVGDATLLLTGEMNHHDAWEAAERGISVILVGHYESEVVVCSRLASMLRNELKAAGFSNAVRVSGGQRSPLWIKS